MNGHTAKWLARLSYLTAQHQGLAHHKWRYHYRATKRWWKAIPRNLRGGVRRKLQKQMDEQVEKLEKENTA